MKLVPTILPFVALASAFVIPDEKLTKQMVVESQKPTIIEKLREEANTVWSGVEETFKDAVAFSENAIDNVLDAGKEYAAPFECHVAMMKFDTQAWLDSAAMTVDDFDIFGSGENKPHPPHDGPHHPHHPPHHGHDGHKPNKTVYELIASSKYTTKLAELINEYPDLVKELNGTKANYTIFAPTNAAFEKIPKHHKKPSKEVIKKVLAYHVSPDFYPAGRVLVTHTIPTALGEDALGGEPQRLRVGLGLKGLTVNFYSRVIGINFFGTNGVIHAVDSLLLPPPPALKIIELLPGEFSTLQLGLQKTGLFDKIAHANHTGGTFFAPNNWAFQKLGPRITGFLFSKYGEKYLKALLEYHVVANQTLYSDAFYKAKSVDEVETEDIPKGHYHLDLPTLLEDKSLSIDVARWGGWITIKINGFSSVAVQDGIAKDGVLQVLSSVLIPPKTPGGAAYMGEELDLEDFKERLLPFVPEQLEL